MLVGFVGKKRALEELESYLTALERKSLVLAANESGHYYPSEGADDHVAGPRYTLSPENQNDACH